jgi:hypothetical protein
MVEATTALYLVDNAQVANLPIELLAGLSIHPHADWTIDCRRRRRPAAPFGGEQTPLHQGCGR